MMQTGRYVVGEWDGGGGGGCIYRSAGITWAAGSGFKIQAHPCLSSVPGFTAVTTARVGSPESCLKPVHGALVIPAPQPASASPTPVPLTDGCTSSHCPIYIKINHNPILLLSILSNTSLKVDLLDSSR